MYTRTHPFSSWIKERYPLTGPTSSKKTYHISLDTTSSHLSYKMGDSIGVLPSNDPVDVKKVLQFISATGEEEIFDSRAKTNCSLHHFLLHKANLFRTTSALLRCLFEKGGQQELLDPLLQSENRGMLNEFLQTHTLSEILALHPNLSLSPHDLAQHLLPLMPRFYSIANSPRMFPDEIHLTVAYVSYSLNGRLRRGVGSHFLCDLARLESTPIPIYLQPSHAFTLPEDPNASIIFVGPGTGVAPFRAFLQERLATKAMGRNWLFFGERNRATDFYYEPFWLELESQGRLRLDLAFSRDGPQKSYVQHKMYERRKSLWDWLQGGSYFYVCGDAQEMAKDVDAMLHRIVAEEGKMHEEEARLFVKQLRQQKRYLTDVY